MENEIKLTEDPGSNSFSRLYVKHSTNLDKSEIETKLSAIDKNLSTQEYKFWTVNIGRKYWKLKKSYLAIAICAPLIVSSFYELIVTTFFQLFILTWLNAGEKIYYNCLPRGKALEWHFLISFIKRNVIALYYALPGHTCANKALKKNSLGNSWIHKTLFKFTRYCLMLPHGNGNEKTISVTLF